MIVLKLSDYIASVKDKSIAVIGLGVSNMPLIRLLLENGCKVTARDRSPREKIEEKAVELERSGARLYLGDEYLKDLSENVIFRTPGLRPDLPEISAAVKNGSELTSEMEVFFRVCPCKMIAVTGSDGKTTTTSVIAELLRSSGKTVHLGGNIGRPLLCDADKMTAEDIVVLELSSFQLMTMKSSPDIAVVTNLAPNHLDMHRDMAEYTEAKENIFLHQSGDGKLVLNLDNDITASFAEKAKGETLLFSRREEVRNGVFLGGDGVIYSAGINGKKPIMKASDIRLPGVHNIENYMAAFAAVRELVPFEIMEKTAKSFKGVPHRIEHVRTLGGVDFYNDSIASSPSRSTAGLRSFDKKVIMIAGGKDKGVPFDGLGVEIAEHVKTLVVTGWTAEKIKNAVLSAPNYKGVPNIIEEPDFKEAVLKATRAAKAGDVVILSPACTSFDRFKNFEERGNYFKEIVNSL